MTTTTHELRNATAVSGASGAVSTAPRYAGAMGVGKWSNTPSTSIRVA